MSKVRFKIKHTPSCFDRESYNIKVTSLEFPETSWTTQWADGCAHWHPLANAHIRPMGDDRNGVRFEWSACNGCKHKL